MLSREEEGEAHPDMVKNRFWGCIYDAPVSDHAIPSEVDLTVSEISAMQFIGLPVRIEHHEGDIGRVIDSRTDPTSGRTEVCFELDRTPRGITARSMIQKGAIRQLSLKHLVYPNRLMVPVRRVDRCLLTAGPHVDLSVSFVTSSS